MIKAKKCSICKITKDETNFGKRRGGRYLRSECKECGAKESSKWRKNNPELVKSGLRKSDLRRNYGLSLQEYDELLKTQNGECAICFKKESSARRLFLSVDHDHHTDEIRGLLCNKCNRALGYFNDDCKLLQSALKYLNK